MNVAEEDNDILGMNPEITIERIWFIQGEGP